MNEIWYLVQRDEIIPTAVISETEKTLLVEVKLNNGKVRTHREYKSTHYGVFFKTFFEAKIHLTEKLTDRVGRLRLSVSETKDALEHTLVLTEEECNKNKRW